MYVLPVLSINLRLLLVFVQSMVTLENASTSDCNVINYTMIHKKKILNLKKQNILYKIEYKPFENQPYIHTILCILLIAFDFE